MLQELGYIGGGRVTKIFLGGFQRELNLNEVVVSDINAFNLNELQEEYPQIKTSTSNLKPANQKVVFLAAPGSEYKEILTEIKKEINQNSIIVALDPVVSLEKLSSWLDNNFTNIVRMVPNAPSIVNQGYNPVVFHPQFQEPKEEIKKLFRLLGECPEVNEEQLPAYAVLTAMGPTYLWFQLQELEELGATFGLTEEKSEESVLKMALGAVKIMLDCEMSGEEIRNLIPGKPLKNREKEISLIYREELKELYAKIS